MTITYIYLRHAPKEHKNGQSQTGNPQHDSPIMKDSVERCHNIGRILYKNYGEPNIVIMSPYRRTVQTAEALMNKAGFNTVKRQIYVDNNIAEFLGNQKGKIDITSETLKYGTQSENHPPLRTGETVDEFKERIIDHLEMLQILSTENEYNPEDRVIWVITHGFVINTIYNLLKNIGFRTGGEESFYPDELEGIVVRVKEDDKRVSTIKIFEKVDGSTTLKIPFVGKGK